MTAQLDSLAANRQLVRALGLTTTTSLTFLGGLSCCLSTWIIPLLQRSLPTAPRETLAQFDLMIYKGFTYLQTSSRILGALLASLTFLTYRSRDPLVRGQFRFWAAALAMLVPIAPYEVYFIFPSNDRIKEIQSELKGDEIKTEERDEVRGLLERWQWRNGIRFATPVVAGLVGMMGMLKE